MYADDTATNMKLSNFRLWYRIFARISSRLYCQVFGTVPMCRLRHQEDERTVCCISIYITLLSSP